MVGFGEYNDLGASVDSIYNNFSGSSAKEYNDLVNNPSHFKEDLADMIGWGSARRDREWQEMMSNTAYQRAALDMKLAGINPAIGLASSSARGASTPNPSSGIRNPSTARLLSNVLISLAKFFV